MPKHLWEVTHSYYCTGNNFFASPDDKYCVQHYLSWEAFCAKNKTQDKNFNLVFRWDWDEETDILMLFVMEQRKGLYRSVEIQVTKDDEESVKAWLLPRWEYMKKLWEPFF